jgi:hypothetical protein
MGGRAFSLGPNPLYTPRMPREVYETVRDRCQAALRGLFVIVASPIDGPGKSDFGDIDLLVALEKRLIFPRPDEAQAERSGKDLCDEIAKLLQAEATKGEGMTWNLAIPWPSEFAMEGSDERRYIQVDVKICASSDELQYSLFQHAHGDIFNVIGSLIRPLGLTINDKALWLRVPGLEEEDKKRAKVQLTAEPGEILHFIGLQEQGKWDRPFEKVDDMFEYVTTSDLFWLWETQNTTSPDEQTTQDTGETTTNGGSEDRDRDRDRDPHPRVTSGIVGEEDGKMKPKDYKKRIQGRPTFQRWIEEFIPRLQAEDPGRGRRVDNSFAMAQLRDEVRDKAFGVFPATRQQYQERVYEWRLKKNVDTMKALIPGEVSAHATMDPSARSGLCTALRRIMLENDASYGILPEQSLRGPDGFYDEEAVRGFIRQNWEHVRDLAVERQKQRMMAATKRSNEKKRSAPGS